MKIITLNIEGSRHLDRCIPFLIKENADVVCLQEVFKKDMKHITQSLGMRGKFVPTSIKNDTNFDNDPFGIEGVVLLTKNNDIIEHHYYRGSGTIPHYVKPYAQDKVVVYSTIMCDGKKFIVGSTHFTWTPDGKENEQQILDFQNLARFLSEFDEFILCGDFNAPRGGSSFARFTQLFADNIPLHITTTLDKKYHRKGDLQLVVDNIFTSKKYGARNVKVVDNVSDHMAIVAEIDYV